MTQEALPASPLLRTDAFIAGIWTRAARTFPVVNPATGARLAEVADVGVEAVERAIAAAAIAMRAWSARTALDRGRILRRWHDLMLAHQEQLAAILTAEQGKPLAEARGEVAYAASFLDWFAEEGRRVYGELIPAHHPDLRLAVLRQPVGVVAAITPWNFPMAMITRKVAPALAAGCAVIVKPSDLTPLSALALAALAQDAGLPDGLLSIITSTDTLAVGAALAQSPVVRKLSFTGSTPVGQALMRQSANTVKKLSLELGGNAPFIVFDDADLDQAVAGAIASKFRNAGQTCVCTNRIYVQARLHDAFVERFVAAVSALKVGPGSAPDTAIGPLIDSRAVDKVRAHIADALAKGGVLCTGGTGYPAGPLFFQPTVITGLAPDMRAAREETFGPLAMIARFEDEDEVIARANDSDAGLAAYFYARDLGRVWRVAEALEFGMIGINTSLISTEVAPFGGIKTSGLGREGSRHGIEDYLELKYLCMAV